MKFVLRLAEGDYVKAVMEPRKLPAMKKESLPLICIHLFFKRRFRAVMMEGFCGLWLFEA